ncbi:hypothetical protein F2Q70_00010228 [Brassica cretica]|uniref:Uncharacterized protein n=1 Tax=Brassica cretica TaxID=69181 RepID=A0A8S9MDE3_BRACR|nr:hypothetical protein F2Q70_00010228 [Brassica cretica]KAF3549988.1 hypothetical protein DY000_02004678 [Brassica cretica]
MKKTQSGGETRWRAGNGEATTPELRDRIPPLKLSHEDDLKTEERGGELQWRKQEDEKR